MQLNRRATLAMRSTDDVMPHQAAISSGVTAPVSGGTGRGDTGASAVAAAGSSSPDIARWLANQKLTATETSHSPIRRPILPLPCRSTDGAYL